MILPKPLPVGIGSLTVSRVTNMTAQHLLQAGANLLSKKTVIGLQPTTPVQYYLELAGAYLLLLNGLPLTVDGVPGLMLGALT